jgi:hypothetical protein
MYYDLFCGALSESSDDASRTAESQLAAGFGNVFNVRTVQADNQQIMRYPSKVCIEFRSRVASAELCRAATGYLCG